MGAGDPALNPNTRLRDLLGMNPLGENPLGEQLLISDLWRENNWVMVGEGLGKGEQPDPDVIEEANRSRSRLNQLTDADWVAIDLAVEEHLRKGNPNPDPRRKWRHWHRPHPCGCSWCAAGLPPEDN